MPLSCKVGVDDVCSIDLDDAAWTELRARNAKAHDLRLPCCGSKVVLKTSKLGTQFFAHARKGDCTTGPETAEHLFVKARIAQAIVGTGWSAGTEVRGVGADGSEWVADVMAKRGERRVAFEVQWSPQSHEETSRRQGRLKDSGVRGLWLFQRPSNIPVSQAVPSVLLDVHLNPPAAGVRLPAESLPTMFQDHSLRTSSYHWAQTIELSRFVRGCLSGAFVWAPGLNQRVPLELHAAPENCWKCHRTTMVVTLLVFRVDQLLPGAKTVEMRVEDFDNPAGERCLSAALNAADLKNHGIGALKRRFSRTRGSAYLSNGCVHCDALQGAFFEHEIYQDAEPTLTVGCEMAEAMFEEDSTGTPFRWCFDERFEAQS